MSLVSRRRGEECLSDLSLDVLIAGDASPELSARARTHAEGCEPCRARWKELSAAADPDAGLASSGLHAALVPELGAPAPGGRLGRVAWRWAGVTAAAAGALLMLQRLDLNEDATPAGERLKGGGRLGFFVERSGEVTRGGPGEQLRPGDAVQFTYFAPSAGYLVVLSRDAAGAVSVYYPSEGVAAPVAAGEQTLSTSTLLDGALGEETIEAVFCARPERVEALRAARERPEAALAGCSVDSLRVHKDAP